jgi:hypothetical protein
MATRSNRPSPPYPANEHKDKVKVGNDGRKFKSVADKNGVYRWKVHTRTPARTPARVSPHTPARVSPHTPACAVYARLMVVLDDKLGVRADHGMGRDIGRGRGVSGATKVPPEARSLVRRRISGNDFSFEFLAVHGVILKALNTKKTWFGLGRPKSAYAPVTKFEYKLVEHKSGYWSIDLVWHVGDGIAPDAIDLDAFRAYLDGQLSDGWGEGVQQLRFGPITVCDDPDDSATCRLAAPGERVDLDGDRLEVDLDGRYAFNLTTFAGHLPGAAAAGVAGMLVLPTYKKPINLQIPGKRM